MLCFIIYKTELLLLMNNIVKVIIATAVGASIMKIFGNTGILVTLGLIAVVLGLIYKFQNKMLYMPGTSSTI